MISKLFRVLPLFGAIFALTLTSLSAQSQEEIDCRAVVENFRQNVESAPSHVLTLLEDALIANGGHCVAQFVQVAIETGGSDADTVKKIVFVALSNAQAQSPQIAEAAVSAAPKHADAVREAFAEAFSDKNPRLAAAPPAEQPAWAEENAPVPKPKSEPKPEPAPQPAPSPKPAPAPKIIPAPQIPSEPSPAIAANSGSSPYDQIDPGSDAGWELLHDGMTNDPIDPSTLAAAQGTSTNAPAAVEPELPEMKKHRFGIPLPKLPPLPALPEVDRPIDLMLSGPFAVVPPSQ